MKLDKETMLYKLFLAYCSMSVGNMNNRAAGIRSKLPQYQIDNFFREAIQNVQQISNVSEGTTGNPFTSANLNLDKKVQAVSAISPEQVKALKQNTAVWNGLPQEVRDALSEIE
tara:strand:- start:150 stop:491 length:342 start_codon:yes stop_codon:yes gene_type:complete